MIKSIFVDLDGVIFQGSEKFSIRYAKEFEIDLNVMTPFLINQFKACLIGEADLENELIPILSDWKWTKSAKELINYWLDEESKTNDELIDQLNDLSNQGFEINITTQQEKNRAEHLQEILKDKLHFKNYYSTHIIHYLKSDTKFYSECLKKSNNLPKEVIFIDDDMKNILKSKEAGLNSIFYENNQATIDGIQQIINANKNQ